MAYVGLFSYICYMASITVIWFGWLQLPLWILILAYTVISLICGLHNMSYVHAVRDSVKNIDAQLEHLYYYDTDTLMQRRKIVVELLYIRQCRVEPLVGTMFEDKTYPHIDNFGTIRFMPHMLKGIVPNEFWVQKY